jgi:hypothetical protein
MKLSPLHNLQVVCSCDILGNRCTLIKCCFVHIGVFPNPLAETALPRFKLNIILEIRSTARKLGRWDLTYIPNTRISSKEWRLQREPCSQYTTAHTSSLSRPNQRHPWTLRIGYALYLRFLWAPSSEPYRVDLLFLVLIRYWRAVE